VARTDVRSPPVVRYLGSSLARGLAAVARSKRDLSHGRGGPSALPDPGGGGDSGLDPGANVPVRTQQAVPETLERLEQ